MRGKYELQTNSTTVSTETKVKNIFTLWNLLTFLTFDHKFSEIVVFINHAIFFRKT